jgi:plastocyanin
MRHTLTLAAAVLAVALSAAGCGSGGGSNNTSTPTSPGASSVVTVTITGHSGTAAFNPNPATADGSQTVQFTNNDTVTHHIMMDDGSAQTADIPPGTTSVAIAVGSNKSYHCVIHPGMVGGFNGSTGNPPPNCTYQYCALRVRRATAG